MPIRKTPFATPQTRRLAAGVRLASAWLLLTAAVTAQPQPTGAPRIAPVIETQRSDEQRAIAADFAASGMTNAVAILLNYPLLARPTNCISTASSPTRRGRR